MALMEASSTSTSTSVIDIVAAGLVFDRELPSNDLSMALAS